MNVVRKPHLWYKRLHLKNHKFSIIANNCIGGIICHDLDEQFRSPTINLWMTVPDFVVLCGHLEYYLQLPIHEIVSNESCPVGELRGEYGNVRIFFQHYKTFEEANAKWIERVSRINWDSIYLICEAPFEEETTLRKLLALPYKKRVITHTHVKLASNELVKMPNEFYFNNYVPGKIIHYSLWGYKRPLEKLDYVEFLNK